MADPRRVPDKTTQQEGFDQPGAPEETKTPVIILVGDPGVGKSSVGNALVGRNVFESGLSLDCKGVTISNQTAVRVHDGHEELVIDTPGLADIERSKEAAHEITKALKQPGRRVKVNFIVKLESGRIRVSDILTVKGVLAAVKQEFEFGIIVNKVVEKLVRHIAMNTLYYRDFISRSIGRPPTYLEYIQHEDTMYEKDNAAFSKVETERICRIFDLQRGTMIAEHNVNEVDIKTSEEYVKMLAEEKKQVESVRSQLDEVKEDYNKRESQLREDIEIAKELAKENEEKLRQDMKDQRLTAEKYMEKLRVDFENERALAQRNEAALRKDLDAKSIQQAKAYEAYRESIEKVKQTSTEELRKLNDQINDLKSKGDDSDGGCTIL